MDELAFGLADLGDVRRLVASRAREAGLSSRRASDMALAADEIATNALVYGRPPATARVWRDDGEVVCEVTDAGEGIQDPDPGWMTPPADAHSGRGLWLARQLCDQVEIRNDDGCTVLIRAGA
jgi:anti-sigma regulatory factor (Ser/Thr protein kinase)